MFQQVVDDRDRELLMVFVQSSKDDSKEVYVAVFDIVRLDEYLV